MTRNARDLRRNQTAEERAIWQRLRETRPRFTRQLPVGPYILDLACRSAKIAVELDGAQHLEAGDYDAKRTAFLNALSWRVLRFWNSDVRENADGIVEVILAAVANDRRRTHPRRLPFREG